MRELLVVSRMALYWNQRFTAAVLLVHRLRLGESSIESDAQEAAVMNRMLVVGGLMRSGLVVARDNATDLQRLGLGQ